LFLLAFELPFLYFLGRRFPILSFVIPEAELYLMSRKANTLLNNKVVTLVVLWQLLFVVLGAVLWNVECSVSSASLFPPAARVFFNNE
jgi:hypothetical protein